MMDFFKICGFAAICCSTILLLSGKEKELSSLTSSLLYVISFIYVITRGAELITEYKMYFRFDGAFLPLELILQMSGLALGGAVASAVCETVGQKGIGTTIEILSIIEIIYIAMPTVKDMLGQCIEIFGK